MKKIILFACLLAGSASYAQNGLEGIIVEKYYISDANDATVDAQGGTLPVNSVTYRIFIDMLPGYKFQALYGINAPVHELSFNTTTCFFNNIDRGATTPAYTKTQARNNTVMLDSWFSAGAGCSGNYGILKSEDDGVATVLNSDGVLQNTDARAGIPVKTQDGLITGTPAPETVTFVGLTTELDVFGDSNCAGSSFSTINGSIASLNGSSGPTAANKVLIGQFTTDGLFCFKLNIQIGTPTGGVENYVAENPTGAEIQLPGLMGCYDITTGVEQRTSYVPAFRVSPNPASSTIALEINALKKSSQNSYTIYDMLGNKLSEKELGTLNGSRTEYIDISTLPQGVYFLQLTSDGFASARKVVKN